jgi:uncharacterized ferritin-like protein (DUF455 family)
MELSVGSVEHWAHRYVTSDDLAFKLAPGVPPDEWLHPQRPLVLDAPGRPAELALAARGDKTPGPEALRSPERRARLLHTFLHHELQAAELMCRAVLAFPDTPPAFRRGLIKICLDEVRHMDMYAQHIADLGFAVGDFPVNDWFWQRVPRARGPAGFVAVMGLGFEGANLDHTQRFAERFRRVGDVAGARLQEQVGEEEVPHVAFGAHWFSQLAGALDFDGWAAALPEPLSPMLMRGRPLNRAARTRAGYPEPFLERLERWQPAPPGS